MGENIILQWIGWTWNDLQCPLQLLILDGVVESLQRKVGRIIFSDKCNNQQLNIWLNVILWRCESCTVSKPAEFNTLYTDKHHCLPQTALCLSLTHFICPTINQSFNQWTATTSKPKWKSIDMHKAKSSYGQQTVKSGNSKKQVDKISNPSQSYCIWCYMV